MKFIKNAAYLLLIMESLNIQAQKENRLDVRSETFYTIVPKDLKIEKVSTGYLFTEGPVWNRKGFLLFSDIPANTIYKLTPDGKSSVYRKPSQNSNALTYDPEGNLVICEQLTKRVAKIGMNGESIPLADKFEGKTFNSPNDLVFKKDGSFFFSDPPYGHEQFNGDKKREMDITGVYYVKNGRITLVESSLPRANGLCLSPDEKKLYVCQSEGRWVWKVYDIDADGQVTNGRVFFEGTDITGNPDGIKVDEKGYIYATGNHGVIIFSPDGKLLGVIKLPENPANLAWGDDNMQSLYITAATSIYRIKLNVKGHLAY